MQKQSFLPIKFFHRNGVQDYEKIRNYSGDWVIPKYPMIAFPGFQLVLPDTVQDASLSNWTIGNFAVYIVDYDSGTEWDVLSLDIKIPVLYDADTFWVYVMDTFPWESLPTNIEPSRFYYRIEYDSPEDTVWYSEIFELCNLEVDALKEEFTNVDLDSFSSTYTSTVGLEYVEAEFCDISGGGGTAQMPIECFPGEEFDIYIRTLDHDGTPACASGQWAFNATLIVRGDSSGQRKSKTITMSTTNTQIYTRLEIYGGTDTLDDDIVFELEAQGSTKGKFEMWVQRTYKADHIQLRYTNTKNFCNIVYEDGYETRMFLNAKQVIDVNQLEEETVEDDQANKYRLIGTVQKWNSVKFVGGESLLNAMSLLRLHDDITIVNEDGEPMDVAELILEQSVLDYEAAEIKLVYREDSCSWNYCEFSTV